MGNLLKGEVPVYILNIWNNKQGGRRKVCIMPPRTSTYLGAALLSGASFALLSFIASEDKSDSQRNPRENDAALALGLFTPGEAQKSSVHIHKSFLSEAEIQQLITFVEEKKNCNGLGIVKKDGKGIASSSAADTVWSTSYLHTNDAFAVELPALYAKIFRAMVDSDQNHFHILNHDEHYEDSQDQTLNLRTVEFHEYTPGGSLREKLHYDAGSIVTIDICLGNEFEGGELTFPEVDGSTTVVDSKQFQKGDAAFFMSHKYHNVLPVTGGLRRVLVAELWRGPNKTCPHRCCTIGSCDYNMSRNLMERSREHLSILG